jgi:hypothetical protein
MPKLVKNSDDVKRSAFFRNQAIAWLRRFKPEVIQAIKELADKKFPKKPGSRKTVKLEKELEALKG